MSAVITVGEEYQFELIPDIGKGLPALSSGGLQQRNGINLEK